MDLVDCAAIFVGWVGQVGCFNLRCGAVACDGELVVSSGLLVFCLVAWVCVVLLWGCLLMCLFLVVIVFGM